jgi:hypothetical protein
MVALADQTFRVRRTTVRQNDQPDQFEADFFIEEKTGVTPPVLFTLDDLIAGLNNLKTAQSVPGTARIGTPVTFSLRWT